MTSPFRLSSITFTNGEEIAVAGADIIVLVGPNNSGKSMSLREIVDVTSNKTSYTPRVSIRSASVTRNLSGEQLTQWYKTHRSVVGADQPGASITSQQTNATRLDQLASEWDHQVANGISVLPSNAPHLIKLLSCDTRLSYEGQAGRREGGAGPSSLVHWLIDTDGAMERFSQAFYQAFGYNVILDAWGSNMRLRLSRDRKQSAFTSTSLSGLPDPEITAQLEALPLIENQSDGVRSFASVLQHLSSSAYPLVLIDEPEAFLHPPQARLMGRNLAAFQHGQQVVVATHSLDVLLGLLDSPASRVQVLRLTRSGDTTTAKSLEPDQLRQLWSDPFLRFSRVLDGLFHHGVVACEGDSDSQFYSGVADLLDNETRDVMFTYAGGKQRLGLIARSLVAVGVPICCTADFDLLNDRQTTRSLLESLQGNFTDQIARDLNVVDAAIRGHGAAPTLKSATAQIEQLLTEDVPDLKTLTSKLQEILKPQTGWRAAKKSGISAVPNGESTAAANRLLEALKTQGLFVIPVGEVESFVPEVGGHGPSWVASVAEGGHLATAQVAKQFVSELLSRF